MFFMLDPGLQLFFIILIFEKYPKCTFFHWFRKSSANRVHEVLKKKLVEKEKLIGFWFEDKSYELTFVLLCLQCVSRFIFFCFRPFSASICQVFCYLGIFGSKFQIRHPINQTVNGIWEGNQTRRGLIGKPTQQHNSNVYEILFSSREILDCDCDCAGFSIKCRPLLV